jgi:hypothetical protein
MTRDVAELTEAVLNGQQGGEPAEMTVTSAFWLHHTTRLRGAPVTYRNYYLLVRVGESFGACSFEPGEFDPDICAQLSGHQLDELIRSGPAAVRIAALDAFLAEVEPHHVAAERGRARPVELPAGTPDTRARARDDAVAGLLDIRPDMKVALIGVVNPLVAAINDRGAECLPCDFNLRRTASGQAVTRDMNEVLDRADAVIATGMTLGNESFDVLLDRCREQETPLAIYAQTGSAVARAFVGAGVSALSAEPFPFSQFSARPTMLYCYYARE